MLGLVVAPVVMRGSRSFSEPGNAWAIALGSIRGGQNLCTSADVALSARMFGESAAEQWLAASPLAPEVRRSPL